MSYARLATVPRVMWSRLTGHVPIEREGLPNSSNRERILFVANSNLPTLQLSFLRPLSPLIQSGDIATELVSEIQLRMRYGKTRASNEKAWRWIEDRFERFNPTVVVFCRYSGPHAIRLADLARTKGVPSLFQIDDDLLNVPREIGDEKYRYHNAPARMETVKQLLGAVDVVYCSTRALKDRLNTYGIPMHAETGAIYCAGEVLRPATSRPVKTIGYMGFDHESDFEIARPAILETLTRYPDIHFELFGSIPKHPSLDRFGARIKLIPPVPQYGKFMETFAGLNWDIGICPLRPTDFNAVKANTKWVEYTSVGAAVIASAHTVYDDCCDNGNGILADNDSDWIAALDSLISDPARRHRMVLKAQEQLTTRYSLSNLRNQVLDIMEKAHTYSTSRR